MKMLQMKVYSLGYILYISFVCFTLLAAAQTTDPSEVSALRAIKGSLIDPMKYLNSWNKGDPCASNWTGVLCIDKIWTDGYMHVQELHLLNMNLSGHLAPELGQLSHIKVLDFMWNGITGSIPKEIGNIIPLRLLLLNGNKLSSSLPDEIGYLRNLNRLQIDLNQISGPIPKSFVNLTNIQHFHFSNNFISGQIPTELSKLPNILHLLLDNNKFSGYLPPEFSEISSLTVLQLDNNHFYESEIPASYGNMANLLKLSLRNCSLKGAIPDLSRIPNLLYLDLSQNQLSGSIPPNKLSGKVTTIDLSNNQLDGSIPANFSKLPNLQRLDLRNNSLSNCLDDFNPLTNVTIRLRGNPLCNNAKANIVQFCEAEPGGDIKPGSSANSPIVCHIQSCPADNFYEYAPNPHMPCFCAAPLRVGYRMNCPMFSYFSPYEQSFNEFLTNSLNLDLHQLNIDSVIWEEGPKLRMLLKIFPLNSSTFNTSEIQRIKGIFTTWTFPPSALFGSYELLNFTLLGPYSNVPLKSWGRGISKGALFSIVLVPIACVVTISAIILILVMRLHRIHHRHWAFSRKHLSSKSSIKIDGVRGFTFKEMALATENFKCQVGEGGYGKVYKGILADSTVVAIKRAQKGSLQGQKEFLTEIELLSRLHHRNLVSLVGYCDEKEEQMLIYEFMPNGTLCDWLSAESKESLRFATRLHIALGSAKGILYLHTEAYPPIFHRDIKASNILLDSMLTAKVADFGLSRLAPVPNGEGAVPGYVSTIVKGTPGYLDPEYFLTRNLTDKSDVYSLGVVFLELLTGMQPISHGKNIVREVNLAYKSGKMFSIVDSRMESYPAECVYKFVALATRCCKVKPQARPSMLEVVRELENILCMMEEYDTMPSESMTEYSGKPTSPSSSCNASRDLYFSSDACPMLSGVDSSVVSSPTSPLGETSRKFLTSCYYSF